MSLTFNDQPCEIVQGPDADGQVCIRYAGDPRWPFPSYTWVSPKALKKTTEKQKRLEALQGVEDALMQVGVTLAQIIASRPVLIDSRGYSMTKEMLDELLYLIELQIKANIAIALGHADAADKEAEKEHVQYYRLVSLIESMKDDLK